MESEFKITLDADWAEGEMRQFQWDERIICVGKTATGFFAIEELCPHRAGPLSEGKLLGNQIHCPWHGAVFDIYSGHCLNGPAKRGLRTFFIAREDNALRIQSHHS